MLGDGAFRGLAAPGLVHELKRAGYELPGATRWGEPYSVRPQGCHFRWLVLSLLGLAVADQVARASLRVESVAAPPQRDSRAGAP